MILKKEYILALKTLRGVGTKTLLRIGNYIKENHIDVSSSKNLVYALETLKIKVQKEPVSAEMLEQAVQKARYTIDKNARAGIGITTFYDDDFPSILRQCINEEGKQDPPMILYYKGDLNVIKMPRLAVIGTREVTEFGARAGMLLSQEFAKRGFCIISGLALGCDTIGHEGALAVGGKTIAFLAQGLDSVYPPENEDLAQQIINNGGLLLSEYSLGTSANRYNFVARDRLQAGMSLATLVIQTGENGGAMHAANATLRAQKPLFVIKFKNQEQNEHEKSLGNALLVNKGAKYITGDDDIENITRYIMEYQRPKNSLFD